MRLIVGLGNPGSQYKNNRHNVGFLFLDSLSSKYNFSWEQEFSGEMAKVNLWGEDVILFKPLTYMNLSGNPVKLISMFYKIQSKDILVVQDEINVPFERLKISVNRSAGGHNGIQNIFQQFKTQEIARLRVGIGENTKIELKNFVLGNFSKSQLDILFSKIFLNMEFIVKDFLIMSSEQLCNKYNGNI